MEEERIKITFLRTGRVLGVPVWDCDCETCEIIMQRKRIKHGLKKI